MIATKGRASYFKEDSKGYIDPGAQSSVYILKCDDRRRGRMTSIVIVSHSYKIAEGVKDLNLQMTDNDVNIIDVGGLDDKGIGTSFDRILSVINELDDDAICFYDIGSAGMNLDMAIEMYEGSHRIEKWRRPS